MKLTIFPNKHALAQAVAERAAATIRNSIQQRDSARIVAATGSSQFEFLDDLTKAPQIDWQRVEMFHLDEYIGLPESHPASFRKYLRERLIDKTGITRYHLLDGEKDPRIVIDEMTAELRAGPIDIVFLGLGENGHLAFNDPPADFTTSAAYSIVELDEANRKQQFRQGWFKSLDDVPLRAISMTIPQIMQAAEIICIATEKRKARAVARCFQGEISPLAPASILRTHANAFVYLDKDSASLLAPQTTIARQQEVP